MSATAVALPLVASASLSVADWHYRCRRIQIDVVVHGGVSGVIDGHVVIRGGGALWQGLDAPSFGRISNRPPLASPLMLAVEADHVRGSPGTFSTRRVRHISDVWRWPGRFARGAAADSVASYASVTATGEGYDAVVHGGVGGVIVIWYY